MTNPVSIDAPEGLPFIDIVREFDAPVAAVYNAHQDPELVKQWLGPDGFELEVDEWNFATHGSYRYVHLYEGERYGFNGTFHLVRENALIVQTFEFDGWPDVVSIETQTFSDLGGGRTRLTSHSAYPSVEARDQMYGSDMETGIRQGYRRLDGLVETARIR